MQVPFTTSRALLVLTPREVRVVTNHQDLMGNMFTSVDCWRSVTARDWARRFDERYTWDGFSVMSVKVNACQSNLGKFHFEINYYYYCLP